MRSPSQALSLPVGIRRSHESSAAVVARARRLGRDPYVIPVDSTMRP